MCGQMKKEKQILTLSEVILRWSDILVLAKQPWICNNNREKNLLSQWQNNRPKKNRIFILVFI